MSLLDLLEEKKVIMAAGPGGVGKTTTSATLGLALAQRGKRVCVVTVDPAKRLAEALGVTLDNSPSKVECDVEGELHAMMLDARATFEGFIRRDAPSPDVAERLLNNVIYNELAGAMAGTLEYAAVEKLHELYQSDAYDVVVIDTPPSKNVIDFLDAPQYVTRFLDEKIFKWFVLLDPNRPVKGLTASLLKRTGKIVWELIGQIFGSDFATQLSQFMLAMESYVTTFRGRAEMIEGLMRSPSTAFVVITSPDDAVLEDAAYLCREIRSRGIPFQGFVVNRTYTDPGFENAKDWELDFQEAGLERPDWSDLIERVKSELKLQELRLKRQDASLRHLRSASAWAGAVVRIPWQGEDLNELKDLEALIPHLDS